MRARNIFVSHRSSDHKLAVRLADALRTSGHQVWLALWEVRVGESIPAMLNKALEQAEFVVVCYSPQGLGKWMSAEVWSSFARQMDSRGVKLLPVRLPGGKVPALLAGVRFADLNPDWNAGLNELMQAIDAQ